MGKMVVFFFPFSNRFCNLVCPLNFSTPLRLHAFHIHVNISFLTRLISYRSYICKCQRVLQVLMGKSASEETAITTLTDLLKLDICLYKLQTEI